MKEYVAGAAAVALCRLFVSQLGSTVALAGLFEGQVQQLASSLEDVRISAVCLPLLFPVSWLLATAVAAAVAAVSWVG